MEPSTPMRPAAPPAGRQRKHACAENTVPRTLIAEGRSMKHRLVVAGSLFVVLLSSPVRAGQQWQCGDGLTVPLTGSRAERDAVCREAKERRDNPAEGSISQE